MPASTRRRSTEEYKREAVIGISLSFSGPVGNTLPGNRELERLEKAVPEPKKGLWVDPQPVPPGSGGGETGRKSAPEGYAGHSPYGQEITAWICRMTHP
jgi:hypothetical protein